jgi:hypothetical protein
MEDIENTHSTQPEENSDATVSLRYASVNAARPACVDRWRIVWLAAVGGLVAAGSVWVSAWALFDYLRGAWSEGFILVAAIPGFALIAYLPRRYGWRTVLGGAMGYGVAWGATVPAYLQWQDVHWQNRLLQGILRQQAVESTEDFGDHVTYHFKAPERGGLHWSELNVWRVEWSSIGGPSVAAAGIAAAVGAVFAGASLGVWALARGVSRHRLGA